MRKQSKQHELNGKLMEAVANIFGQDNFNKNWKKRNINLSIIIYFIYKIISTIDNNTQFFKNLKNIFEEYHIITHKKNMR